MSLVGLRDNLPKYMRNVAVVSFLLSLCLGVFLPVYSDEVGWRFQERAGFDGVDKMFSDTCGPNALAVPPFFMWPVRHFSAFFNAMFADPLFVRLSGVGYALVWALLLLRLIGRIANTESQKHALTTIGFALMSLGVMSLLLVWSRPEQPIILAVTAALLICWASRRDLDETPRSTAWLRSIAIVALSVIAVSYHPKGMVLAPVFGLCLVTAVRGWHANLIRMVCGLLLVGAVALAARYWSLRLQCPDDPILNAAYGRQNLALLFIQNGWSSALTALIANLNLVKYVKLAAPAIQPMSQWLAPEQIDKTTQTIWRTVLIAAWVIVLLPSLAGFVAAVRRGIHMRAVEWRAAMAFVIFGCSLAWCATQAIQNVYEASFVLPLLMIAFVFSLATVSEHSRLLRGVTHIGSGLGIIALVSQVSVIATYGPSFAHAARTDVYFVAHQPNSIGVFGYAAAHPDIVGAAQQCGIAPDRRANSLLVDEITYFTFMTSYRPQFRLGVFGLWKGSISDPIDYLRERGSDGIITACQSLPPDLAAKAHRQGQFCCLGPDNW